MSTSMDWTVDAQNWIRPEWSAPARVQACSTTRLGGFSEGPFAALNLADHVGDDPRTVAANRARLSRLLDLPAQPVWLHQMHGRDVVDAGSPGPLRADASYSRRAGVVCAVLTADCLPVLLCDRAGTVVAVAHAGWRGLAAGVIETLIETVVERARVTPGSLLAWLGPAIGPRAFRVGDEVRDALLEHDGEAGVALRAAGAGRWLVDIYGLARRLLGRCGVRTVSGGGQCTVSDPERFFSYRRDGVTGRMATLIWLQEGGN